MAEDSNTTEPDGAGDGGLSQDDIDAAFGGGGVGGEEPAQESASPGPGDAADEMVGQDDIDALLQAASGGEDAGAMSQADIDAALGGGPSDAADSHSGADTGAAGEDSGELTQADIDAALAGGGGASSEVEAKTGSEEPAEPRLDMSGRPFDAAAEAMAAAIAEEQAAAAAALPPPPTTTPVDLPDFGQADASSGLSSEIDLLHDVTLRVKVELGRTRMQVEDVLRLGNGSVIELDRLAGDPVDVYANDRLVVRGEVLVLNDSFCVRVSEIISAEAAVAET